MGVINTKAFQIVVLGIFFGCCSTVVGQQRKIPQNGENVIVAMFEKYKKKWYKEVTFVQQTLFYKDGVFDHKETWYEAMRMPDGLVIKINDLKGGNGIMFKQDSQYVWRDNSLVSQTKRIHDLLVLGFRVYFDSPDKTIKLLEEIGYDFDYFEIQKSDQGKTEFVIGHQDGARFWIDAEKLVFTKLQKISRDNATIEMQFNDYQRLGKAWIAAEVVFLNNGVITTKEIYNDIIVPKNLPANLMSTESSFAEHSW